MDRRERRRKEDRRKDVDRSMEKVDLTRRRHPASHVAVKICKPKTSVTWGMEHQHEQETKRG